MIKFYHFCEDEKFINSAFNQFEAVYPGQNIFYIYNLRGKKPKYITLNSQFLIIDDVKSIIEKLPENSVVFFHSLPPNITQNLKFLPKSSKAIGLIFGFEAYNDPFLYSEKKLLDKITIKLSPSASITLKAKIKEKIWPYYRIFKKNLYLTNKERKLISLKRLDFIGTSFEEEYKKIKKILKLKRPLFNFWYYPLEQILNVNEPIKLEKTTIMIGHSGFKTLNHLDVFQKLNALQIKNQEIIVPLSYGDQNYINIIKNKIDLTENSVSIIEEFMNLDDYQKMLNQVKIAILNTRRQQAVGNVIALVYAGAKVFISELNPFYHFLKRNSVIIYSYEKDLTLEQIRTSLNENEINKNREILFQLLNRETLKSKLRDSLETIIS